MVVRHSGDWLAAELLEYGPEGRQVVPISLVDAQAYCRRLAREHYENFHVASRFLPRDLDNPFCAVYAWCRWADDLADESTSPEEGLRLLDWWEASLDECFAGRPRHPVLVALADTIDRFSLPRQPFIDLLTAFRQDQLQSRYETFDELLQYCRNSANPVGRLVLSLAGACDDKQAAMSDSICTGLQLANFWQGVAEDWKRGRLYVPLEDCRRHGVSEDDMSSSTPTPAMRRLLEFEVNRTTEYFARGLPLVDHMPRGLRGEMWLFIRGGQAILQRIRRARFDVWTRPIRLSRVDRLRLVAGWAWRRYLPAGARGPA